MLTFTWHLLAVILLGIAILCHCCAAAGIRPATGWVEWAWAAFTGAVLCLVVG